MSTVNKEIADLIIAGKFDEDGAISIVKYLNAWGNYCYGVGYDYGDPYEYLIPTEFIRNPVLYWTKANGMVVPHLP